MNTHQPSTNATDPKSLVGWVSEDSGRGTLSVIKSSLLTILICTWTTIHPRIHTAPDLKRWHKGMQLVKMILAPEMVCLESLQEWIQANNMKKRAAAATKNGLKLVHAYYIGMLGIRYRTVHGHKVLWPSQYIWLLNRALTDWKQRGQWGLSEDLIRDKSKADWLVKLTALCQVTWFTFQCIARAAQRLPICPLETMTLAYVFVTMITYIFWWKKPKDIATAVYVDLPPMKTSQLEVFEKLSMESTYDEDGLESPPSKDAAWYLVARDCGKDELLLLDKQGSSDEARLDRRDNQDAPEESPCSSRSRSSEPHTQHAPVKLENEDVESCKDEPKIEAKVITQWDDNLYMTRWWPLLCAFGASFGAFHLISWSSEFPTTVELDLWRVSTIASVVTSVLCMQFRTISLGWDGPLTLIRIGSPVVYMICRVIMVVQSFAALRAMPAATYQTLDIWNYWFHIF